MAQEIPKLRIGDVFIDPNDGETVKIVGKGRMDWELLSIRPVKGGWCMKGRGLVPIADEEYFLSLFTDRPEWYKIERLLDLYSYEG